MKISFHGAARTVTGSKHMITLKAGSKYLLDCGMFQGMGNQTDDLNRNWGFEPSELSCLILSHAHIDHSGLIPKLVKDGFRGPIYGTPGTLDLASILLEDSAEIQNKENGNGNRSKDDNAADEPLYTIRHVEEAIALFKPVDYGSWFNVDDQVELLYTDAGHLIGSAVVNLRIHENGDLHTITFSGDVGRYRTIILKSPEKFPQADYIILESTYGNSLHDITTGTPDKLLYHIKNTCLQKRGKLIIPAFSVGRTQELLYALNQLDVEKRLPELEYFVDSPLGIKATELVKKYPDDFKDTVKKLMQMDNDPFAFRGLKYIADSEESKKLNDYPDPCVIIASSGMAEAGRIRYHIRNTVESISNTILIVGYCDPETLGGKLRGGAERVYIMGDSYDVKADVAVIQSLSAHGDYSDLLQFMSCQDTEKVKSVFLVHGEYDVQEDFRQRLNSKGFKNVFIPSRHDEFITDLYESDSAAGS
jgi:metallo-beta-lactamase family protein